MHKEMKNNSRRRFISGSAAAIAGIALGIHKPAFAEQAGLNSGRVLSPPSGRPIHVFTKLLQFLSYREMAEVLAENGFDGADLTVRLGGQVLPENVETDLPKAVKALRDAGVDSYMITTGIVRAEDKWTRPVLKTMADLGIRYYRTGYLDYNPSKSIPENLEEHKFTFEKLEKLNREYGVHGGYQNHSGRRVGGPAWDLYMLLKDRDPEFIGVQYDIRHATVEGGVSWPLGLKLLAPWIKTTDIKDFIWEKNEEQKWQIKNIPLGEGMVDFDTYFELCKSLNIVGPVSIHYEYDFGGAEHGDQNPEMPLEEMTRFMKKDLNFLKEKFQRFGL
jgi:L-ribulose-5-phosphate 3-epimerase